MADDYNFDFNLSDLFGTGEYSQSTPSFMDSVVQSFSPQTESPTFDWESVLGMSSGASPNVGSIPDSAWMPEQQGSSILDQLAKAYGWATTTGMSQNAKGQTQGISPLGALIGGATSLDSYLRNRKLSDMAKRQYETAASNNAADRAYAMQKRATNDMLGGAFDVQVDPRKYLGLDPMMASKIGKLNRQTGSVYSPVMYDKSLPTATIVPRAAGTANPLNMAKGGLGMLRGSTTGQADQVPANLSHGEYVMDADVVSALGDGNTEAGAAKLDQMREQVRQHKRSAPAKKIPPKAKSPLQYMKGVK